MASKRKGDSEGNEEKGKGSASKSKQQKLYDEAVENQETGDGNDMKEVIASITSALSERFNESMKNAFDLWYDQDYEEEYEEYDDYEEADEELEEENGERQQGAFDILQNLLTQNQQDPPMPVLQPVVPIVVQQPQPGGLPPVQQPPAQHAQQPLQGQPGPQGQPQQIQAQLQQAPAPVQPVPQVQAPAPVQQVHNRYNKYNRCSRHRHSTR